MKHIVSLWLILFSSYGLLLSQNTSEISVLSSQQVEMLPYKTGIITPVTFYDESFTNTLPHQTVQLYETKLEQLISFFGQNSLLKPPIGFEVKLQKRIEITNKVTKPTSLFPEEAPKICGSLEIHFSPYYLENGKPAVNFKVTSFFWMSFNNPYELAGTPIMADVYPCPQMIAEFHGYPIYATNREEVTIINFSDKPLFVPVSQEDFIDLAVLYWEQKIKAETIARADYLANISKQNSNEETQRQQADFEQAYNQLLQYDKTAAADLKKTFEEVMAMNLHETNDVAVFDSAISFAQTQILRLNEELAAMSPSERKRQGVYSVQAYESFNNASGLVPPTHKANGDALVRINPDLVDASPEKIHIISIHYHLLNHEFDKPRSCQLSNDAGYITDNKLLSIYSDTTFWNKIFESLQ
jgi:hypothetical protein